MIKIENVDVYGWEPTIRGMRNPKNSWHLSDSYWTYIEDPQTLQTARFEFFVGENDLQLMKTLASAGSDHGKFLRFIDVTLDITAPLYWWKEFDTYKVGTVANSCSTMHKITAKEFTEDDFSHEHLIDAKGCTDDWWYDQDFGEYWSASDVLDQTVLLLNFYRKKYLEARTKPMKDTSKRPEVMKNFWWQLIQLLPSSYNQCRTVKLNYAVLKAMYHARKNHKLDEWRTFCEWIESLPYARELIVGE